MRYSIRLLLLCMSFHVIAFQPPEKKHISPQEFAQEVKRKESYLSLLPADVSQMVKQYTYPELEYVIAAMRNDYLANALNRDSFLHDPEFNRKIINEIVQRFELGPMGKFKVALMLNTPGSFKIAAETVSVSLNQYLGHIRAAFTKYIKNASINYQDSILYTQEFIRNVTELIKKSHPRDFQDYYFIIEQNRAAYTQDWIPYFINSIITVISDSFIHELKKEKIRVPEVKVAFDIGTGNMQEWIWWILKQEYGPYQEHIPHAILRFIKRNYGIQAALLGRVDLLAPTNVGFYYRMYDQFKIAVCNDIADLLTNVLKQNGSTDKIDFLLNIVTGGYNKAYSGCMEEKMQGELGVLITTYLLDHNFPVKVIDILKNKSAPYLITHAIRNVRYTPELVINLLHLLNVNLQFERYNFSWWEGEQPESVVRISQRQLVETSARSEKQGTQILLALVQSHHMNVAVLNEIIAVGADVNGADQDGVTVLMHAIKNARFDMANILLNQPTITINTCDTNGHNALSFAELLPSSQDKELLIKRLKEMGAEEGICAIQ